MSEQSGEKIPSANLKLVLSDSSFNQKQLDQNSYTPTNKPIISPSNKNCPRCQFPNEKLSKFCSECGYKLFVEETSTTIQASVNSPNGVIVPPATHNGGGYSVPTSPKTFNYGHVACSAQSSPTINQIFWSDSDFNPMRYADDGYGNTYPISPSYYAQSPTTTPSGPNTPAGTSSSSIPSPPQSQQQQQQQQQPPPPPIATVPTLIPSLQPNEYIYNDFVSFEEWNYKRNKPTLYFTPLLSYPPEYCQTRMLYYNYIPDNPTSNLIDYFPHLSPQDFHLLTSLYNISIVNEIKPEYLKIYREEGCMYCLSVYEKKEPYMVFQCVSMGCIHFIHLSCLPHLLGSIPLLDELLLLHTPPLIIQSNPMRQPERGIDGCQYSGYTCYWEIDFKHLLGGMSSLFFAISDIPIYTSPRERGFIIYLENNNRDIPDLQKCIPLCGRFILHFYINNTGYSNSYYACYDLSQCDRNDLTMTLCDVQTNTIITVTFYELMNTSSLLLHSFKMVIPSVTKLIPTLQPSPLALNPNQVAIGTASAIQQPSPSSLQQQQQQQQSIQINTPPSSASSTSQRRLDPYMSAISPMISNNGNNTPNTPPQSMTNSASSQSSSSIANNNNNNNSQLPPGIISSPSHQNTIIKPIPLNCNNNSSKNPNTSSSSATTIPLMTMSSISGAQQEFESIANRICELALTQSGSKSLQKLIESTVNKPMLYDLVINECIGQFSTLMMNSFANYFVQTLFKNCNHVQQIKLLQDIAPSLATLIYDKIGTYALQNIIQQMKGTNEGGKLLMNTIQSLNLNIKEMIKDNKGTHIIQKLLKCFDEEVWECLPPIILKDALEYCYDKNGSMVCRTCIDVSNITYIKDFTNAIKGEILQLSQHDMGNYVIQHLLIDRGDESIPITILEALRTHYSQLSNSKISSNVVEKCLMYNNEHYRDIVIEELFTSNSLPNLISNKFGTYVIQKACSVVTSIETKQRLYRILHPLIKQLLTNTENADAKWVGILEKLNESAK